MGEETTMQKHPINLAGLAEWSGVERCNNKGCVGEFQNLGRRTKFFTCSLAQKNGIFKILVSTP